MEKVHVNVDDINPVVHIVMKTTEETYATSYCCYIKASQKSPFVFFKHLIFVRRILNSLRL
jgi:hypothetical protein